LIARGLKREKRFETGPISLLPSHTIQICNCGFFPRDARVGKTNSRRSGYEREASRCEMTDIAIHEYPFMDSSSRYFVLVFVSIFHPYSSMNRPTREAFSSYIAKDLS
jgi:hypothetical protein